MRRSGFQRRLDLRQEPGRQLQEVFWARSEAALVQLQLRTVLANDVQRRPVGTAARSGQGGIDLAEFGLGDVLLCLPATAEAIDAARDRRHLETEPSRP